MKKPKIRVFFSKGYMGDIKAWVNIGDERREGMTVGEIEEEGLSEGSNYVLDIDELEKRLEREIEEKGYTVSKTTRQKYPRLIIND